MSLQEFACVFLLPRPDLADLTLQTVFACAPHAAGPRRDLGLRGPDLSVAPRAGKEFRSLGKAVFKA